MLPDAHTIRLCLLKVIEKENRQAAYCCDCARKASLHTSPGNVDHHTVICDSCGRYALCTHISSLP